MHEEPGFDRDTQASGYPDVKSDNTDARNSIKGESYNVYRITIPILAIERGPLFTTLPSLLFPLIWRHGNGLDLRL
jgi:hypothetical protein